MAHSAAVLFDIDGTLTDSNYLHVRAWRLGLLDAGHDVSNARIHRMIGAGSGTLLDELIGEESSAAKDGWRRHFEALKGEIRPLPGAADLLRAVAGRGVAVMLATSSEPEDVEALREAIDADDAITGVTSAGDVDEAKPSPAVFEAALEQAGVGPDRAIVVGDSAWDIKAARRAGMDCVMLLSGGNGRCELEEAGGLAGYEDPADLLAHLDESPLARLWR